MNMGLEFLDLYRIAIYFSSIIDLLSSTPASIIQDKSSENRQFFLKIGHKKICFHGCEIMRDDDIDSRFIEFAIMIYTYDYSST
jgi:hypothetical protein